ncbi:MAG: hypothetical protein AAB456_02365 [Patescibacteria group bacterium]
MPTKGHYRSRYSEVWEFDIYPDRVETNFNGVAGIRMGLDENQNLDFVDPPGGPFIEIGGHTPCVADSVTTAIKHGGDKWVIYYRIQSVATALEALSNKIKEIM